MKIGNTTFEAHRIHKSWWLASELKDSHVIEERARAINALGLVPGYTAICAWMDGDDDKHKLYLVDTEDPIEILRIFSVGKGGECFEPAAQSETLASVSAVHKRNPITPFFADTHGFKFVLSQQLHYDDFSFYEEVFTTGTEVMLGASGKILETILEKGYVHLWWD